MRERFCKRYQPRIRQKKKKGIILYFTNLQRSSKHVIRKIKTRLREKKKVYPNQKATTRLVARDHDVTHTHRPGIIQSTQGIPAGGGASYGNTPFEVPLPGFIGSTNTIGSYLPPSSGEASTYLTYEQLLAARRAEALHQRHYPG